MDQFVRAPKMQRTEQMEVQGKPSINRMNSALSSVWDTPAQKMMLDRSEQRRADQPDCTEQYHAGKEVGRAKRSCGEQYPLAKPAAAGQHFADDRKNEGDGQANAHARQNIGQCARQCDLPDDVPAVQRKRAADFVEPRFDRGKAVSRG